MKKLKRLPMLSAAIAAIILSCVPANADDANAEESNTVNITVDTSKDRKEISPYIYGVNSELMETGVTCTAIRAGGNRFTAYNWETGASNAGSDWNHNSDSYFLGGLPDDLKDAYGSVALNLSRKCAEKHDAYSLMTLLMAGYVAADMDGEVTKDQAAPSDRWNKVELTKDTEFSLEPDLSDGTVYMDEFVNYLVNTLGDSQSKNGINGYSLDNEPALWKWTHERIHPEATGCEEIVEKSVIMAKAVKDIDPNADIFGPALFGYGAFTNFGDSKDWKTIKQNGDYDWFIDYYLDEMKKAEDETGVRLLDVLDIHYYTEAKGECGKRSCDHYDVEGCVKARLDSTRSLWDADYMENSWITDSGAEFWPLLPNIQQSIDKYYPGTKIAITEYDFGGCYDISGGIAEADALGVFAKNGVYFATLFAGKAEYQCAAIDLYTNYNGKGSGFGDTLVYCETDNVGLSTAYAAVDNDSDDVITLIVTNKSFDEKTTANIKLVDDAGYEYVHLYCLNSSYAAISDLTDNSDAVTVSGDTITYEMEPESVSLLVIGKDKAAVDDREAAKEESFIKESITEDASDESAVESESQQEGHSQSKSMLPWILGGVAVAVAVVCAAVIAVFKKRRSE